MFHIFCTFVSQSRAFLSQLSVTGDESVFFMRVRKDTIISFTIKFFASVFFTQYIIQDFLDIRNHCIATSNRNYTIQ